MCHSTPSRIKNRGDTVLKIFKNPKMYWESFTETSLGAQWLRLHLPGQGLQSLMISWGVRFHMPCSQKIKALNRSNNVTKSSKIF